MNTVLKTHPIQFPPAVHDRARVWIYQAERSLNDSELVQTQLACEAFVTGWQAHGNALHAHYQIYFKRFIVFFVNPDAAEVSGCSIDASMHFVQDLEKRFGMSLTGRTQVALFNREGHVVDVAFNDLADAYATGEIDGDTMVFNNLVSTKKEMEREWVLPFDESWHRRMVP